MSVANVGASLQIVVDGDFIEDVAIIEGDAAAEELKQELEGVMDDEFEVEIEDLDGCGVEVSCPWTAERLTAVLQRHSLPHQCALVCYACAHPCTHPEARASSRLSESESPPVPRYVCTGHIVDRLPKERSLCQPTTSMSFVAGCSSRAAGLLRWPLRTMCTTWADSRGGSSSTTTYG